MVCSCYDGCGKETPRSEQAVRVGTVVGEMLFAHLKRILKLDKLCLRDWTGAQDEFLLAATAQNLPRLAKRLTPNAVMVAITPA